MEEKQEKKAGGRLFQLRRRKNRMERRYKQ